MWREMLLLKKRQRLWSWLDSQTHLPRCYDGIDSTCVAVRGGGGGGGGVGGGC